MTSYKASSSYHSTQYSESIASAPVSTFLAEFQILTPGETATPCSISCTMLTPAGSEFMHQDYFAIIEEKCSALVLSKKNGEFQISFRPLDWKILEDDFKPGQTFQAHLSIMGKDFEDDQSKTSGEKMFETVIKESEEALMKSGNHPQLVKFQMYLHELNLGDNQQISYMAFLTVVRKFRDVKLTEDQIRRAFRAIDTHGLGFVYFEDIVEVSELSDLGSSLRTFFQAFGIFLPDIPEKTKIREAEEEVLELDIEDLREYISQMICDTTRQLHTRLNDNQHSIHNVAKNQRIQEVQMRQLIQEEFRNMTIEHAEASDCTCVIS